MNTQLQTFIKYFIHRFDFLNYEMILRTFNCTIVNQIKSSKKLVVKLKIRNMQLLQMKTIFKLFFGRVPLFSHGNKWATVWSWLDHTSVDVKEFLQANEVSPGPAVYHLLTIRLHTEFVWLSSQMHPDRLSTPTAGSVRWTFNLLELWVEISRESFFSKLLCTWIDKLNTLPLSSSPMHFWRCSFSSWIALTGIPVRANLKFLLQKRCSVLFL